RRHTRFSRDWSSDVCSSDLNGNPIPVTMRRFGMHGTPTTIIIDQAGCIVEHAFGKVDDLALGVLIGSLTARAATSKVPESAADCADGVCPAPAGNAA